MNLKLKIFIISIFVFSLPLGGYAQSQCKSSCNWSPLFVPNKDDTDLECTSMDVGECVDMYPELKDIYCTADKKCTRCTEKLNNNCSCSPVINNNTCRGKLNDNICEGYKSRLACNKGCEKIPEEIARTVCFYDCDKNMCDSVRASFKLFLVCCQE